MRGSYRAKMNFLPQGLDPGLNILGRLGLDVLTMLLLVGWLYRRRLAAPEMALVFSALNVGLFAAVVAIGSGDFPTGVGFGLFGLLSLVRLRSAAFTLRDMAYTFVALVAGLVNGLSGGSIALVVALDLLLIAVIWTTDDARDGTTTRAMRLTLDVVCRDLDSVRAELKSRLDIEPHSVAISDIDFVRETTRVWVRYDVEERWGAVPELVTQERTDD
jgi:hypothetical protein